MIITGKVVRLGGPRDHQGDRFAPDCALDFLSPHLPVVFAMDPSVEAGVVEDMWLDGDTWMARVSVHRHWWTPLSVARGVVPGLGLSVKGLVTSERREGEDNVIEAVQVSGLMVGINVDLDMPDPGFVIEDPKFRFRLVRP
jgi:hypothetical protein